MRDDQVQRYARHLGLADVGGLGQTALLVATARLALREPDPTGELVAAAYLAAGGAGTLVLAGASDDQRAAIAGRLVFDGSLGGPVAFDREAARAAMAGRELLIRLDLGLGDGCGEAFGCDLTEDYVIENSEYTT